MGFKKLLDVVSLRRVPNLPTHRSPERREPSESGNRLPQRDRQQWVPATASFSARPQLLTTSTLSQIQRSPLVSQEVVTRLVLLQSGKMVAEGLRDAVPTQEAIQDVFQVEAELVATKAGEPLYFFHPRGLAPS